MQIDKQTIKKLSNLSKLSFSEQEENEIIKDLTQIVTFVEKLQEVDTENVEPLIYVSEERNVVRKDEEEQTLTHEQILMNAPKKDSDYFRAPKVIAQK